VALDGDVGKCGTDGGVEQLLKSCDVNEHVTRPSTRPVQAPATLIGTIAKALDAQ
jgi:hypothetical protein